MKDFLDRLLYRYNESSYIIKNKARFILYLCIVQIFIVAPFIIVLNIYQDLHSPEYNYSIRSGVVIPVFISMCITLIVIILLVKGYFIISGHLFMIICLSAPWAIMFIEKSETLARLNTIVFVTAILSMMPVIILSRKAVIIIYTAVNIILLLLFMLLCKEELNVSYHSFIDYISDNILAFLSVGIISYNIFSINHRALEKAETEIAERKKTEEQRNKLQMQLLQSQKLESVGLLAGGVAHDFNNILATVQGFAELAALELTEGKIRSRVEEIVKASKKARDLTRQLLAFAKVQPLTIKNISINTIVTDFIEMLSRTLRDDIIIKTRLYDKPGIIEGDQVQIEQVLLNMMLNSQDAMPEGGTIHIETSEVAISEDLARRFENIKTGTFVLLSISDTGSGIDPGIIHNIFDPFYTTKDFGKGTGLGLSTVYGIVKQHKGFIHVYSEKNMGTNFKIYFPLIEAENRKEISTKVPSKDFSGNETILAVEDNPDVRNLVKTILKKYGYTTLVVHDARTAISLASTYDERIDLLVTDVIIPDMNGMYLFYQLQALRPGIKVIYISGYTANVITGYNHTDGEINFIQKPFSIEDFVMKIREVLDS
jgi:signal transduction histidine kinase/CheY-like chemotaxis protein